MTTETPRPTLPLPTPHRCSRGCTGCGSACARWPRRRAAWSGFAERMWCGRIKAASLLVAYRCAQVVSFLPLEIRVERTESVLLADLSVIVFSHTTNYLHDANLPQMKRSSWFLAEPLCSRASAEVKRGGAFWLRSPPTRCNDCHGGREESEAGFRAPTAGPGGRRRRCQEPAGGALASMA